MIVAIIEPEGEMPPHFEAYPERARAWEASMGGWRLRYGSTQNGYTHTAAHFGFVRVGVSSAWVWADVLMRHPNKEMLRSGLRAWRAFIYPRPWTLYGRCTSERELNFARFLGFEHIGFEEGDFVVKREPQ